MGENCKFLHAHTPELVDGQDILKELSEDGELKTMLTEDQPDFSALLNKAPLMIFMNGKPAEPLCEFSRTLVGILWDAGLVYDHFNVLSDKNVHQGIKTLSNFMTYPQVFVNGVFVGGLDTIKRLKESGDLVEKLKI
jgi:glutaredoxin-related protein